MGIEDTIESTMNEKTNGNAIEGLIFVSCKHNNNKIIMSTYIVTYLALVFGVFGDVSMRTSTFFWPIIITCCK